MNRRMNILLIGLGAIVVAQLAGCGSTPQRHQELNYAPSYPVNIPKPQQPTNGSLYQPGAMTLFDDSRAHRVGDIITINLDESMTANKKDEAKYDKSNSQDYGINTPLNITAPGGLLGGVVGGVGKAAVGLGIGYGSNGSFSGKSDVKQNSSLSGSISVTVVEVIPNGNLMIRGEKWITIHEGDEVVQFAGIIRPDDIQPDNTISSQKVADVRLVYKDVGMSGNTARAGVATEWLSRYWPF
ncbi:flagellar L-ring protein [Thiosulfatimonas sediminis]|uniref:Flagellar L-ring protein n=1 Tax=Thiosulfatimonas sediminis TaxID=2675054 RepID=A0A6F8PTQ6_9GAMM|nr:flagellar basal body L-ring protein FlgH [Thiosulfatimonas sediminis]BBP45511.1 flagellar L-ring protein [Thiosulfatimonas sediminis]